MDLYPTGAFFCTVIDGRPGFLAALGQALCGKPSRFTHCGIIVSPTGETVEGQPGGAQAGHLRDYKGRPVLVCDGPVRDWLVGLPAISADVTEVFIRQRVAQAAQSLIGTPYSVLDYVALGLLHLHLPSTWVRRRVESSGHLICSALVDLAYRRANIHLWNDGRLPGDCMPADLADWADDWEETRRAPAAA